jgi:hypothetical protein
VGLIASGGESWHEDLGLERWEPLSNDYDWWRIFISRYYALIGKVCTKPGNLTTPVIGMQRMCQGDIGRHWDRRLTGRMSNSARAVELQFP